MIDFDGTEEEKNFLLEVAGKKEMTEKTREALGRIAIAAELPVSYLMPIGCDWCHHPEFRKVGKEYSGHDIVACNVCNHEWLLMPREKK